jgi:hypothetical protein
MRQNFFIFLILLLCGASCKKEVSSPKLPLIKTIGMERVGYTVATCNVYLENPADTTITELGVCWNLTGLPTLSDSISNLRRYDLSIPHVYGIIMPRLKDNTFYYVRSYLKNTSGNTLYGETVKFTTLVKAPVTVLFQQNFENYAWSEIHQGFFIDDEGNIRGYIFWSSSRLDPMKRPIGEAYPPNNNTYYTKSDLEYNYYLTDTLFGKVDLDTLNTMKALIPGLLSSAISDDGSNCSDFGTYSFYAYYYDSLNDRYKRIVIERFGDMCCRNTNSNEQEIGNWLFRISKQQDIYIGMNCNCNYH